MSDPAHGTVEPDRLPEPVSPAAAAEPFGVARGAALTLGDRWRNFTIESAWEGGALAYVAVSDGAKDRVIVHARPIDESTPARREAWKNLCALAHPKVLHCLEAHEEDGWRYEITARPSPMTLRDWIACHQSGADEVEGLVRQLAPAIDALHAAGIVHFNLNIDSIFIEETDDEPLFGIGGLDAAALAARSGPIPVEVDPYYAPPEAVGLTHHTPGDRLYAWDWWSFGRVLQEFLLGRHVLGLLLDCDVSRATPELRERAERLLREEEPAGLRAGAVEQMSADPAMAVLFRGLLTGSCDARWRMESVHKWLKREPVRDYYDLPCAARLWLWRGRAFTLPDAAEFFTQTAHWEEGLDLLFEPDRPDSLAHFLRETPANQADWERLRSMRALTEGPAWQQLFPSARRAIAGAVIWLEMSNANGVRGVLRICGQTIDSVGLGELLKHPGGMEGVALFGALLVPTVVEYIETLDSSAGRVLKAIAAKGLVAAKMALEQGWLDPVDDQEFARLYRLSLERTVVLQDRHALLKSTYATSRHSELARILAERAPTPAELVISAYTGEMADRHGYISHADWRNQQFMEIKTEADAVATALLWLRLHRLLDYGRLWSAPWQAFVGTIVGLGVLAGWLNHSVDAAAAVTGILLLSRIWLVVRARNTFRVADPRAMRWGWRDGLSRATREAARVRIDMGATLPELSLRLMTLRASLAPRAREASADSTLPPSEWRDLAGAFVLSALVSLLVIGRGIVASHPFAARTVSVPVASLPRSDPSTLVQVEQDGSVVPASEVAKDPQKLLNTGFYEIVDDGFGRRLRGPLLRWNSFSPAKVPPLLVNHRAAASAEQTAFAVVSASMLLRPYVRSSVGGLLALRVPTSRGVGLMIFNARDRVLADHDVMSIQAPLPLQDRTWYELGGRHVLYLRSPMPLDAEISLAPL